MWQLGNAAVRIDQAGWATISGGDSLNIPQDSLIFGDSTNNGESMTGILKSSLFMSQTMECEEINTKSATYLENLKANTAPETKNVWQSPAIVVVEDFVTVSASGVDVDGDNLRMKLTFFGVSEENCDKANCGDLTTESFGTEGSATIHGVVKYQRAGRYVVRVQVTDMLGHTATEVTPLVHGNFTYVTYGGLDAARKPRRIKVTNYPLSQIFRSTIIQ